MKSRNVVTVALLLFVAVSMVVLAARALGWRSWPAGVGNRAADETGQASGPTLRDGVIVYYFHGNTRCETCENIKAYAREAVESGFAGPLEEGRLEWRAVNYELPENEHFAAQFELIATTVVLVEMRDGSRKQWKNLVRVWELVGDKESFVEYVRDRIGGYLE